MKTLEQILNEIVPVGSGRGEGPSAQNRHHYHKHPKSDRGYDEYHPWGPDEWPYEDPKGDLRATEDIADEGENELEELPEDLNEFFKFKTSMQDGGMEVGSGVSHGSGAPRSYGRSDDKLARPEKDMEYDISDDVHDNEEKLKQWSGRHASRAQKISEFAGPGLRYRNTDQGGENMSTEDPWASGFNKQHPAKAEGEPEYDGQWELDKWMAEKDRKPEMSMEKEDETMYEEGVAGRADSAYSVHTQGRKSYGPKADLDFLDDNPYDLTNWWLNAANDKDEKDDKDEKE